MPESTRKSRPFAPFEWMIALRYLRARRKEGFVSFISVISLIGIALGVAIVMSVMGGFRQEFMKNIMGFNGHVTVAGRGAPLVNYDAMTARLQAVPGVL